MQLTRGLVAALLLALLSSAAAWTQEEIPELQMTAWEIGTYWTYETVTQYAGGVTRQGPVTFVVLGQPNWPTAWRWGICVIWDWYDRSKRIAVLDLFMSGSDFLRWPPIVEFLSVAETTSSKTGITVALMQTSLALGSKPIHIERVIGSVEDSPLPPRQPPDWLLPEPGSTPIVETVTLAAGEPCELDVSAGTFVDALPVEYTWTGFLRRVVGRAWWSPDLAWWIHAEGREETEEGSLVLGYTVTLTDWGVFAAEELTPLLGSALQSMESAGHFPAGWLRFRLEQLGFEFP